jgi:hypothetical protein
MDMFEREKLEKKYSQNYLTEMKQITASPIVIALAVFLLIVIIKE